MIGKLLQRRSDHETYSLIIHSLIRTMLMNGEFKTSYQQLAVQMFPFYESASRRQQSPIDRKIIKEIGSHLIMLDEEDHAVATCVSVAATLQVLLFCTGEESDLLIGVKKIDEKLFAHAWIRLADGEHIDAQNKYRDLKITKVLRLKDEAERWAVSLL